MMRNAFLESLRMHTDPDAVNENGRENNVSDDEVLDSNRVAEEGVPVPSIPAYPRTRVTLRRLGSRERPQPPHPALET